ncbi:MAG: hypothetical protein CMJ76_10975 [Planctomycetaceae bacterium]|nr:hypothetical protein [Planctomycetaceae bacterium]|tara:strand:+ start:473 stop:1735 length:1263 start_codon:yes stop_codon:yes gene_type:complete
MHTPISRREVLKASGVAVSLPLLESMSPVVLGQQQIPPKRMVMICSTLGLHSPSLYPQTTGKEYETTEYLSILQKHRKDFSLIAGLSHPEQTGKEPHDTEMTFLSAARNPGLGGFRNSISVDQVAAAHIGNKTRFSSVALSTEGGESQSYDANGVMIPAENRPSQLFAKMFLQGSPGEVHRQRRRLAEGRSILDLVGEQTRSLQRNTSSNDRRQLDEFFASIREAEQDLKESEAWLDKSKPKLEIAPPQDIADKSDLVGRTSSWFKIIPLILQTDSSRVISMVIQDHLVVPQINGVTAEHHNLSHHGQDPNKIRQLKIIETALLDTFNRFLTQMTEVQESGKRLLDHTSVLLGSNLGNANAHDPKNLPIIVAGGGYEHGRFVKAGKYNKNTPLCNLYVNLLRRMGVETDSFGTNQGVLDL